MNTVELDGKQGTYRLGDGFIIVAYQGKQSEPTQLGGLCEVMLAKALLSELIEKSASG